MELIKKKEELLNQHKQINIQIQGLTQELFRVEGAVGIINEQIDEIKADKAETAPPEKETS